MTLKRLADYNVNGRRTRMVLSDTKELYTRLEELRGRKQELEDAIQALQQSATSAVIFQQGNPEPTAMPASLQSSTSAPKVPRKLEESDPQSSSTRVDDSFVDAFGKPYRTLDIPSHLSC
jgi:hypothetical protein